MNPASNNTAPPSQWVEGYWREGYAPPVPGYPPAEPQWVGGHYREEYVPPQQPQNPQYDSSRTAYRHPAIAQAYSGQAQASSSSTAVAIGHQIPEDTSNESLIVTAIPNNRDKNRSVLRHFAKWKGDGSIYALLNSGQSAYGNPTVQAWLKLPKEENPYGRKAVMDRKGGHSGGGAITALLKYYGKPH